MYDHTKHSLGAEVTIRQRRLVSMDPIIFPVDSDETLYFLTPILGPTSVLVAHRCARIIRAHGETVMGTEQFARHFGVTVSVLENSFNRLANFGYAAFIDEGWSMSIDCNYIPLRWLDRMPTELSHALLEWQRLIATKAG